MHDNATRNTQIPILPWLNDNADTPRTLFCFPYAGGGASIFRPWRRASPNLRILAVQLPGREERGVERPYQSMDEFLDNFVPIIEKFQNGPLYLFGHSMGALLITALAQRLSDKNIVPAHLFVSGAIPPHCRDPNRKLHKLPKQEFWQEISALNGTPQEIHQSPELVSLMETRLRADLKLCENWDIDLKKKLECDISVFSGSMDPLSLESHLRRWQDVTNGTTKYHIYAGDHFFLRDYMPEILEQIHIRTNY